MGKTKQFFLPLFPQYLGNKTISDLRSGIIRTLCQKMKNSCKISMTFNVSNIYFLCEWGYEFKGLLLPTFTM